jgi:hypothetical protein
MKVANDYNGDEFDGNEDAKTERQFSRALDQKKV